MPGSTAVLLIDLQEAFFAAGPLQVARGPTVAACNRLSRWARLHGALVINARTEHRADRSTWTRNMLEDGQGFAIAGDDDAQPLAELDLVGAQGVVKTRDNAFLGTGLSTVLAQHGIDTILVGGVSTHSCVATTASHAYALDLAVVLVEDAIADERPELHRPTLDLLREEFRFPVLNSVDVSGTGATLSARWRS